MLFAVADPGLGRGIVFLVVVMFLFVVASAVVPVVLAVAYISLGQIHFEGAGVARPGEGRDALPDGVRQRVAGRVHFT